jgi:hypothetical protein
LCCNLLFSVVFFSKSCLVSFLIFSPSGQVFRGVMIDAFITPLLLMSRLRRYPPKPEGSVTQFCCFGPFLWAAAAAGTAGIAVWAAACREAM